MSYEPVCEASGWDRVLPGLLVGCWWLALLCAL